MLTRLLAALLAVGVTTGAHGVVLGAEIKVLSIPFKGPLDRIGPQFERTTGHRLAVKYAPSAPLQKQIDAGAPFDVVLVFPTVVDQLIEQGKVTAGTRVDIARAGLGVAFKKGAAKPDIRTIEAFKRILLVSTSIAYAAQGPSGVHLIGLLDRLEIAQEVKPKLKPMSAGSLVVAPVAKGEVEIGIVSIPFILAEPGVELAGPLPRELQDYVHYSSGIGISAQDRNAAEAFVSYFGQAESVEVLRAHGLEVVGAR
ncbi:MAG: molybdate ABC transporter substrate-binding protein [Xanthobacteraceae bacterium]|nr:molybdate ABC transporter substrate-binding protein [Xanthobacteraceae bacterium]